MAAVNLPNLLTLIRIPLMFAIVWLVREGFALAATAAFVLFAVAGLSDWLDGYLARKRGLVSNFGILMDALADKILILGLMIALVEVGKVSIYPTLLIMGREFLITGMRLVAATKGVVVSAEAAGKQKTLTQILAVGAFLLEDVFRKDIARLEWAPAPDVAGFAFLLATILFWFSVIMTLYSGGKYIAKYGKLVFGDGGQA